MAVYLEHLPVLLPTMATSPQHAGAMLAALPEPTKRGRTKRGRTKQAHPAPLSTRRAGELPNLFARDELDAILGERA